MLMGGELGIFKRIKLLLKQYELKRERYHRLWEQRNLRRLYNALCVLSVGKYYGTFYKARIKNNLKKKEKSVQG